jgi:predicted permease
MVNAKPDAIRAAFREFDERLASVPGVQAVSQTWGAVPLSGDDETLFLLEGQAKPANENDMNWAIDYIVEPGYLKAMGIPLLRGRFFTLQDDEHSPRVVAIDEVFAEKYFPNQSPLGRRIYLKTSNQLAEIVGVVGHVKQWGLDTDDKQSLRSGLYIPCLQMPDDFVAMTPSASAVIVRAQDASASIGLFDAVRRVSAQMSSQQVVYSAQTMDSIVSVSVASQRFSMILLAVFAVLALLLASVGIYGVISYVVSQRAHEIGIRMALGARPRDISRLVLSQGGKLAGLGVAVGVAAALGLTRVIASQLYHVGAADPLTFVGVSVLLTLVALTACYVPARRAAKLDPVEALRQE